MFADPTDAALREWLGAAMARWPAIADHMRTVYEAIAYDAQLESALFPDGDLSGVAAFTDALLKAGVGVDRERVYAAAVVLAAPLSFMFRQRLGGHTIDPALAADALVASWHGSSALSGDRTPAGRAPPG